MSVIISGHERDIETIMFRSIIYGDDFSGGVSVVSGPTAAGAVFVTVVWRHTGSVDDMHAVLSGVSAGRVFVCPWSGSHEKLWFTGRFAYRFAVVGLMFFANLT